MTREEAWNKLYNEYKNMRTGGRYDVYDLGSTYEYIEERLAKMEANGEIDGIPEQQQNKKLDLNDADWEGLITGKYDPRNPNSIVNNTIKNAEDAGEISINGNSTSNSENWDMDKWIQFQREQQNKTWEREDAIRKETQEREDNAWQRAVDDAQAAGVNPNLVNMGPAESGGGITTGTQLDTSMMQKEMDIAWQELETYIMNNWNADQNEKDRLKDLITSFTKMYTMGKVLGK